MYTPYMWCASAEAALYGVPYGGGLEGTYNVFECAVRVRFICVVSPASDLGLPIYNDLARTHRISPYPVCGSGFGFGVEN